MAESKKSKREEAISKNRINGNIPASERPIDTIEFFNTKSSDGTSSMKTYISSIIDYAGQNGFPTKLHFYVTKNDNKKLTDANCIIDLTIPIIPVLWSLKSRESINHFIRTAKNPSEVAKKYQEMDPAVKNQKIEEYTQKIITYITTELALRYVIANTNNDEATKKQISNMQILKEQEFDLKLFEAITYNPKEIKRKKDGTFLVFEIDGKFHNVAITQEQAAKYQTYREYLEKFGSIEKQFINLNNELETYKTYDINESKQVQTIGGHSTNPKSYEPENN